MLDQLVRDYTNNIAEAEQAVAQTIGNLRLAEQDYNEDVAAVRSGATRRWPPRSAPTSSVPPGDAARPTSSTTSPRSRCSKQICSENEAKDAAPIIASQNEVVEKLKTGPRRDEGQARRAPDQARPARRPRQRRPRRRPQVQDAIGSINVLDPTSELGRFEDKVRREEAQVAGQAELAASSPRRPVRGARGRRRPARGRGPPRGAQARHGPRDRGRPRRSGDRGLPDGLRAVGHGHRGRLPQAVEPSRRRPGHLTRWPGRRRARFSDPG